MSGPNLNRFIKGGSEVTARLAWRFAQALGTTPQYWMNLQVEYGLWDARPHRRGRPTRRRHRPWRPVRLRAK